MKHLMTCLAVLALVLGGCSGDDKAPTDAGKSGTMKDAGKTAGDAMKTGGDAAKDAANKAADTANDAMTKTIEFGCAQEGCPKTKEGTMANPPS